jgi:hypothetical protein
MAALPVTTIPHATTVFHDVSSLAEGITSKSVGELPSACVRFHYYAKIGSSVQCLVDYLLRIRPFPPHIRCSSASLLTVIVDVASYQEQR